jgi:hypothetical protein
MSTNRMSEVIGLHDWSKGVHESFKTAVDEGSVVRNRVDSVTAYESALERSRAEASQRRSDVVGRSLRWTEGGRRAHGEEEEEKRRDLPVASFSSPSALWRITFKSTRSNSAKASLAPDWMELSRSGDISCLSAKHYGIHGCRKKKSGWKVDMDVRKGDKEAERGREQDEEGKEGKEEEDLHPYQWQRP